jgi:hypothetical protein
MEISAMNSALVFLGLSLILLSLGLFSLIRIQRSQYLARFQALDLCTRQSIYQLPCSLSRVHGQLMSYPRRTRPSKPFQLEALSPIEFILHPYAQSPQSFFWPYYRLSLDEARLGAQVIICRKWRFEMVLSLVALGAFFGLMIMANPYSKTLLLVVGLVTLSLGILTRRRLRSSFEALLQSTGLPIPGEGRDGGEQQQWAAF